MTRVCCLAVKHWQVSLSKSHMWIISWIQSRKNMMVLTNESFLQDGSVLTKVDFSIRLSHLKIQCAVPRELLSVDKSSLWGHHDLSLMPRHPHEKTCIVSPQCAWHQGCGRLRQEDYCDLLAASQAPASVRDSIWKESDKEDIAGQDVCTDTCSPRNTHANISHEHITHTQSKKMTLLCSLNK